MKKQKQDAIKINAKSSAGKGRLFIRNCLSAQQLAECVQIALFDAKATKEYYSEGALLREKATQGDLMNILYDLNNVTFDLRHLPPDTNIEQDWPAAPTASLTPPTWDSPTLPRSANSQQQEPHQQQNQEQAAAHEQEANQHNQHDSQLGTPQRTNVGIIQATEDHPLITKLKQQLLKAQAENSDLKSQILALKHEREKHQQSAPHNQGLKTVEDTNGHQNTTHSSRVQELEDKLSKAEADHKAKVAELEKRVGSSEEEKSKASKALETATAKTKELEDKLSKAEADHKASVAKAQEEKSKASKALETATAETKELEDRLQATSSELDRLKSDIATHDELARSSKEQVLAKSVNCLPLSFFWFWFCFCFFFLGNSLFSIASCSIHWTCPN